MILAGNEGVGTLCMCPLFTDMRPSPLLPEVFLQIRGAANEDSTGSGATHLE